MVVFNCHGGVVLVDRYNAVVYRKADISVCPNVCLAVFIRVVFSVFMHILPGK